MLVNTQQHFFARKLREAQLFELKKLHWRVESLRKFSISPYFRILVTYKFKEIIFSHNLKLHKYLRSRIDRNEVVTCRVDNKSFNQIQKAYNFLPVLKKFITEVCMNKNYIGIAFNFIDAKEKDLEEEEIRSELEYRKFVIFPRNERVNITKPDENEVESFRSFY